MEIVQGELSRRKVTGRDTEGERKMIVRNDSDVDSDMIILTFLYSKRLFLSSLDCVWSVELFSLCSVEWLVDMSVME